MIAAGLLLLTACQDVAQNPPYPSPPEASTPVRPSSELVLGRSIDAELAGAEVHPYDLDLAAGTFIRLVVEQIDIDVVARLLDPQGNPLIEFDKLTGIVRPELVLWVGEKSGSYRLEIEAFGDPQESGRYRAQLEELRPANGLDRRRVEAEALFAEGDRLRRKRDPDDKRQAEIQLNKAVAIWEELGDRSRQADGLYRLGMTCQSSQPRRAVAAFEGALELLDDAADAWQKAATLHWLGHLHYRLGELEEALELYRRALPLRRRAPDPRGEALTYNNLGLIHHLLGEIPDAHEHYRLALSRLRELGDSREEARTLHNLGKSYLSTGLIEEALDSLQQALDIRHRLEDPRGQASTLSAIGQAYARLGEPDQALGAYRRALELSRQAEHRRGEAIALSDIARTSHRLEQSEKALELFGEALTIFMDLEDRDNEANTRYNIGRVRDALGQAQPTSDYDRLLSLVDATQNRHSKIMLLRSMAMAERQRGELPLARSHLEQALAEIERIRLEPLDDTLRYSYFATKQSYYEAYVDLLMELHRRRPAEGHDAEALTASERARARSQLDALKDGGADVTRGTDPELRGRERALEKEIESLELQRLRMLDDGAGQKKMAEVERKLRSLFIDHSRLQGEIRKASPRYAALTQPRPLSAEDIRRRVVDRETMLLEYDLGERRSYLWAVTPDEIRSFELPARSLIEETAKRAYKLLSSSHLTASKVQAALALEKLSRLLLTPVADLLGRKRLLVVADGALHYIPFCALPDPSSGDGAGGKTTLGALHEIVSVPSASTLAVLRQQLEGRRRPSGMVAVLADPVFGLEDSRFREEPTGQPSPSVVRGVPEPERYERLVFSRQEAEDILALAPAGQSFAAIGFEANRTVILDGRFSDYRFLHFATHGELNTAHPELSRLVLTQVGEDGLPRSGFLFAHEIYNLELAADLVVLSACETALGAEIHGEGLIGLTQGFMYAGAASVIVSLWKVDDQATAELMARFYRKLLLEDLRPAAALRAAQVSISREKKWRAPYYWAGFVLQGDWR